ncbi:amino acid adenylation domain protein [Methylocella silvestris BL2]|uniref:Amino acid adenylation domain protein n=1 Tax=Methylocella silvestris (strain DSM 15510 / CIP 108128 / LMG 27833 / NCIMB 13906 / BL2) TaxID=395965 RepID=B8EQL2_METSB|nr:non-ribosomal peptide synthetase [Methylocella silvestris]ACK52225.1 amino acid adenylation domain protein [Methylocella silvestris BL2]
MNLAASIRFAADDNPHASCSGAPLTLAQRRIWSLDQIGNDSVVGPYRLVLRLRGPLDLDLFRRAYRVLIERHGALSTRFIRSAGGRIDQIVDSQSTADLNLDDLTGADDQQQERESARLLEDDLSFDLTEGLPVHLRLIRLTSGEYLFAITIHAILCDGGSLFILARDFIEIYAALANDRLPAPSALRDFASFASNEQAWLRSDAVRQRLAYWRERLATEGGGSLLPTRPGDARASTTSQGSVGFHLDADLCARLRRLETAACPMGILLLAAFNGLICRYGGGAGVTLGVVVENRAGEDWANVVGRFENVVPLRTSIAASMSFSEAATHLAQQLEDAVCNAVPFERLAQEFSERDGEVGKNFLEAIFEHHSGAADLSRDVEDLRIDVAKMTASRCDANLVFKTVETAQGSIEGRINFSARFFEPWLIEQAARHFVRIVAAAAADPDLEFRAVALLDGVELDRLSAPYEDFETDDERPIHELIAAQAQKRPDAPAVFQADQCWTHGRLDGAANRIAGRLMQLGAGPEVRVAIALRRSPEAVAAILATLKAGAAFVPIEPDHPASRNHHILQDAGVAIIVTDSRLRACLPSGVEAAVVEIDRIDLESGPAAPPHARHALDQLAYVIYTSGSTGLPKGVAVEHGALTRHCQCTARVYEMSALSCELAFLPFSSDGGHERWIVPLLAGGSVVLPDRLWTPEETFAAIRRYGVNNASFPTTYLQQLAEWAEATGDAPPMRLYSFGGEGLPQKTFDLLSEALRAEWLINGYGPTETVMTPMVWKVRPGARFDGTYAPIGRAVGRRRIYILDADGNLAPAGVTGELFIGGDGIARGYLGNPALTEDRFIRDPFAAGGRLYRSGDLARWREDGAVEFMGRVDHQVKLRGFRIELGEIETALGNEPGVSACAVVMRAEAGQAPILAAYAVPAEGVVLDGKALRRALARRLPDYMLPSAILILDRLPLNANSKLDRDALPSPLTQMMDLEPPATPWEEKLAAIWRDVLGLASVGVTQNFFEIGGNSLAALRMLSRIKALDPQSGIEIVDLFNHQDIRSLAPLAGRRREKPSGAQVVRLRARGANPPLYCFPGLLVSTREYIKLVDYLGPNQPATGFLCYSLSEEKKVDASVEEITARYADRVRDESKGQPCFFLGWSWGGLLAFEAAKMLKDDVDVRLIGMVDVCDMDTDFAVGAEPAFHPGERDELYRRVMAWLERTQMRADWDRLLQAMDRQAFEQFLHYVGNSEEDLPTDGPEVGSREHTFWILIDNALIFRRYQMRPFDCPIHSWAAEDSLNRGLNLIDWRSLSRQAGAAEIVAGTTHLHIIGAAAFHARLALRIEEAVGAMGRGAAFR